MASRARSGAALVAAVFLGTSSTSAAQEEAAPDPASGWTEPRAIELAKEAILAKKEGRFHDCAASDRASLEIEEHPYVRLHLAGCYASVGRILDGIRAAKVALEAGIRNGDPALKAAARRRVEQLLLRVAHVTILRKPNGPTVIFDARPMPERFVSKRVSVEPGNHLLEVEGCDTRETFSLEEGEERTIEVYECRAGEPYPLPDVPERIDATVGLETSAYSDTNRVNVLTPAFKARILSTRGWSVAGSYLVDVISAASPDVVSTASPRFHEVRHQVTGGGRYEISSLGMELATKISTEPDCLSVTGGGALTLDLDQRLFTPRIGYAHREDRIGVRGAPFSVLERRLSVNDFEVGANVVMTPRTMLVTAATLQTMRGDPSNPYRYIPIFGADVAPGISPGAGGDLVNATRLAVRPREQLPTERDRFALAARVAHRFDYGTLRLEERVYVDTWGIKASTTDVRYIRDLGRRLWVGPHVRFHAQSGAGFYRLAYVGDEASIPLYRTTARELSPMLALTVGGTARVRLNGEDAASRFFAVLSTDLAHARYSESLFVTSRTAIYGTIGFEAEL
jgi:hypothetical protein